MNKFLTRIITSIIILSLTYTVFWIIAATIVKNKVTFKIEQLKESDFALTFDDTIKTGGFPNKIVLTLINPKLEHNANKRFIVKSDHLAIGTNIMANHFHLETGKETFIDDHSKNLLVSFNDYPSLNLKLHHSILLNNMPQNKHNIWHNLKSLSYKMSNYKILDQETKILLYDVDHTNFDLTHDYSTNKDTMVNVIADSLVHLADIHNKPQDLKIMSNLSVTYNLSDSEDAKAPFKILILTSKILLLVIIPQV